MHAGFLRRTIPLVAALALVASAKAQVAPAGPPAVGVVTVEPLSLPETTEINGRIQSTQRVAVMARVTAFLEEQLFTEGSEVRKGDLLYRLERGPFEAAVEIAQAAVAQAQAQLENATIALARAQELVRQNAGTRAAADDARATQRTAAAQVKSAEAQVHQAQINLDYTEIRSPIDGRIGLTSVTIGNVVGPTSGTLAMIVSLDPMYVLFPVPLRRVLELRERFADRGGINAVRLQLRLPNGKLYDHAGKLDFVDVTVSRDTDTIVLRGVVPNPPFPLSETGYGRARALTNDEFVTVIIEAIEPLQVLAVPRAAILSDQQGDYVYVVGDDNIARQRRVKLGQSTPAIAGILDGLKEGESVVVEGIQRVRPNAMVAPAPASPMMTPSPASPASPSSTPSGRG